MNKNLEMISVVSSNISKIGYDENNKILHVLFLNGSEYVYKDVPKQLFDGLLSANSKGSYLNSNIKKSFVYEKIS